MDHLLQRLGNSEKTLSESALKMLSETGETAFPLLAEGLHSENPTTRLRAAKTLGKMSAVWVEEGLIGLLSEANPRVRHAAICALGSFSSEASLRALRWTAQEDSDPHCRRAALYCLAKAAGETMYAEAMCLALKDPTLRLGAAWEIGYFGRYTPEIVAGLIELLQDKNDYAFPMIVYALGKSRAAGAFEAIVGCLPGASSYQRGLLAQALGNLEDERCVAPLTSLLKDQAMAWKEDYGPTRTVAEVARQALQSLETKV